MLVVDIWKSGHIPLWNLYLFGGTPLLADFQSAPFSPTILLYFLFSKVNAWTIQIILQPIIASLFTYLLLRRWKLSQSASLAGGLVFAFSGFNLIWLEWNGHTLSASFIPLILFLTDYWLKDKKYWAGGLISVSLALMFYSGYPQICLYLLVAVFLYWLFWVIGQKKWFLKTFLLGLFLIIGLGLSGPQIFPGAELLSYTQRVGKTVSYDWTFLPWNKIITFVAPDFFGNHSTGNYWGLQNYTTNTGFVGVVSLSLALFGLYLFKKSRNVKFAAALLVISLVLSFPTPVSIAIWKSGVLGMNASFASRATVLFTLSVAMLSGFGVDYLLTVKQVKIKTLILPGLILGSYFGYALIFYYLTRHFPLKYPPLINGIDAYKVALRNLIVPIIIFISLLVALLASRWQRSGKSFIYALFILGGIEFLYFGWKFTPFSSPDLIFPSTPVLDFLQNQTKPFRVTGGYIASVNTRIVYKIESFEGYEAEYPLSIAKLIAAINSNRPDVKPSDEHALIDNPTSPLADLLNIKYYLVLKTKPNGDPNPNGKIPDIYSKERFRLVFEDKSVAVLESRSVLPRAVMFYDWSPSDSEGAALATLFGKSFPVTKKIIIEGYDRLPSGNGTSSIVYTNYSDQESRMNVTSSKDGLLFVSDTFYPGWKAFVDGTEVAIYRADSALMAVSVPEGKHEVRLKYKPESFDVGIKIAALSAGFLIITVGVLHALGRKRI